MTNTFENNRRLDKAKTIQERFEAKFTKSDGCWEWDAHKNADGYGQFKMAGKMQYAHRVAYQLYVGEIPAGLCVLHQCDNPKCVNPGHLFLGTHTDNMRDRKNKGRDYTPRNFGEKNGQSKLTEEQVVEIRKKHSAHARYIDLAKEFGVSCTTIFMIVCRRNWVKNASGVIAILSVLFLLFVNVSAETSIVTISGAVKDINGMVATYSKMPWVKSINMFDTRLKPTQIEHIHAKLPGVAIGCQVWLVEKHYVRTDATAYAINHNNKSKKHTSADFYGLKYCPDLMALDLSHNAIDDLTFLEYLPNLRVLLLGDNKIENVFSISHLHDLEYLELFKNKIRDITPLMLLSNLLDLNLSHNYIDNLFPLTRLDRIERLWIFNSNNYNTNDPIPKQTVLELQEALYCTEIDSTSYSTLGGWREHKRYYVVFNMLHGVLRWLPWDAEGLIPRYK